MALTLFYGSGSPYAWRVWLALEHKKLPYELVPVSFSRGDLKKPDFLAMNPRGRVPVVRDGDFALYESAAIVEYLDDAYPASGEPLFPGTARERAVVRRLVREADAYLGEAQERLVRQIFFERPEQWDLGEVREARDAYVSELGAMERALRGPYLAGPLSAADFTLYPMMALSRRFELRKPDLAISGAIGERLRQWMARIEALPYYEKTYPPHWRAG